MKTRKIWVKVEDSGDQEYNIGFYDNRELLKDDPDAFVCLAEMNEENAIKYGIPKNKYGWYWSGRIYKHLFTGEIKINVKKYVYEDDLILEN